MSTTDEPARPWGRQTVSTGGRATSRTRKLVEGLPGWEPLPPGEVLAPRRPRA